eukprot:Blabericola_migrator_1__5768@NODE_2921_length_2208_cov_64_448856_g1831_i0_p2_GENE_NODE_2921_length_2208_cov_64_448856_g1831_i0NODE_2921_length_2208_cov_64_448856_g1831_i0_p2_ORF_typecomplete_len182_score21_74zfAN1/PF01428_16/1_1e13zfAN1/PF01428_16/7_9e02zfAN1/PF01428_16/1_7e06Transp_Tc5_C/PF04236_15/0_0093Transp_Tc5_C/PF04236_15/4_8e02Transp_Tc5_C/PF04236_15/3zfC5HC2/PF02928_16/0_42zfC5HC2/PF02928_16/2_9e03zfC5HC2/PF02928_16/0_017DUF2180/PF09947_9/0_19DUF2180/PF09947_9/0_23DUF2180/PF09947_9/1_2e
MAHFSDKGAHCEVSYCRTLDFLPFTCEFCKKVFCVEHFQPESHECASKEYLATDKRVVVCPVCDKALRLTAADDPDQVWNAHNASGDCDETQKYKMKTPKCPVKYCKELLTFSNKYTCKVCGTVVCLKHRLGQDHDCEERKKTQAKAKNPFKLGGTKSVSEYLKSKCVCGSGVPSVSRMGP